MRPSVPTYLSVTQLAHFRALRPHSLHSKFSLIERTKARVCFRITTFRLSSYSSSSQTISPRPFHFTSARGLLRIRHCSIYHGGLHHRPRHSRLIAGTAGRVGRVGGGSGKNWLGIQAYGRQASHGAGSIFDSAPMRKCLNVTRMARGSGARLSPRLTFRRVNSVLG
jgi:hypothetical protein